MSTAAAGCGDHDDDNDYNSTYYTQLFMVYISFITVNCNNVCLCACTIIISVPLPMKYIFCLVKQMTRKKCHVIMIIIISNIAVLFVKLVFYP